VGHQTHEEAVRRTPHGDFLLCVCRRAKQPLANRDGLLCLSEADLEDVRRPMQLDDQTGGAGAAGARCLRSSAGIGEPVGSTVN
jgi:hypothetical protein